MTVQFRLVPSSKMRGAVLHAVVVKHRNNLTGRLGDRIPMGARFSTALPTGHGEHQSLVQWAPGLFPGGNTAGAWGLPPTPLLEPKLKKEYSYTSTPPSGPSWPVPGRTLLYLYVAFLHIYGLARLAQIIQHGTQSDRLERMWKDFFDQIISIRRQGSSSISVPTDSVSSFRHSIVPRTRGVFINNRTARGASASARVIQITSGVQRFSETQESSQIYRRQKDDMKQASHLAPRETIQSPGRTGAKDFYTPESPCLILLHYQVKCLITDYSRFFRYLRIRSLQSEAAQKIHRYQRFGKPCFFPSVLCNHRNRGRICLLSYLPNRTASHPTRP